MRVWRCEGGGVSVLMRVRGSEQVRVGVHGSVHPPTLSSQAALHLRGRQGASCLRMEGAFSLL